MDGIAALGRTIDLHQPISPGEVQALILIVTDDHVVARSVETVCDFLDLGVEIAPSRLDVRSLLEQHRPMAVVVEVDGVGQDGYHVMMEVAVYDSSLPILLLTGHDPALMGAADAVQEICGLTSVTMSAEMPRIGELVDFLFKAGRQTGCARMMPV